MAEKEGPQSAVDFTKYLLTLSGGGIAFVIQPSFSGTDLLLKILGTFSIILLSICVISGLAVLSRGSVMLSEANYSLEDARIKIPGVINVFSFGGGFILLAISVWLKLWS